MLLKEEAFQGSIKALYTQKDLFRSRAWEQFLKGGFPDKNNEAFQYFPLQELYSIRVCKEEESSIALDEILPLIPEESRESYLVFVNGRYLPSLSSVKSLPSKIVIMPLQEAYKNYLTLLRNRFEKNIDEEKDPFALLNGALYSEGVFVYIPPKIKLSTPIYCLSLATAASGQIWINPRVQLFIGTQSELKWTSATHSLTKAAHCSNAYLDVALEEAARFDYIQAQNENESSWYFNALRGSLKQNSVLTSVSYSEGAKSVRQSYYVELNGENSEVDLKGLAHLKGNRKAQTDVRIEHRAPHTRSSQLFKNALYDASRSSFSGKIVVTPIAQKTSAYQLNENLILGEHAIAYGKPNLEIFADDVKASHGATVGQLDERELFYLQSRGIEKSLAKEMLIQGFCGEILNLIPKKLCHCY